MFQLVEWQVRGPHLDSQKGRNLFSLEFLFEEGMRQMEKNNNNNSINNKNSNNSLGYCQWLQTKLYWIGCQLALF